MLALLTGILEQTLLNFFFDLLNLFVVRGVIRNTCVHEEANKQSNNDSVANSVWQTSSRIFVLLRSTVLDYFFDLAVLLGSDALISIVPRGDVRRRLRHNC